MGTPFKRLRTQYTTLEWHNFEMESAAADDDNNIILSADMAKFGLQFLKLPACKWGYKYPLNGPVAAHSAYHVTWFDHLLFHDALSL